MRRLVSAWIFLLVCVPSAAAQNPFVERGFSANRNYLSESPGQRRRPGTWNERGRTARTISLLGVRVELKAGTWQSEASPPGTVRFDNVKVVRP